MMNEHLNKCFFERNATEVAPDLLGNILCRKISNDKTIKILITETEAYMPDDRYCHGANLKKAPSKNAKPQFQTGGRVYIHWQRQGWGIDLVIGIQENEPQSVLIRAGILLSDKSQSPLGVVSITEALEITKGNKYSLNGLSLFDNVFWVEDSNKTYNQNEPKKRVGLPKKDPVEPYFSAKWNFSISL